MASLHGYSDFVLNVADVLFTWPAQLPSDIKQKTWRAFFNSRSWYQYERARISQDECYRLLEKEFSVKAEDIMQAWLLVRDALVPNEALLARLHEIKAQKDRTVRIIGAFCVTAPDYEFFRNKAGVDWSIFDHVFTSSALRERMPEPAFFARMLEDSTYPVDPFSAVFVSHDLDDVVGARSYGMHGLILRDVAVVNRALRNLGGDPIQRGWAYLREHAGSHLTQTTTGVTMIENFNQLLILEATGDRSLVSITEPPRWWNFFPGKGVLTYEAYPYDLDSTALGLSVMNPAKDHVNSIMDEMLTYLTDNSIPWTYFDHTKPRIDPVVSANVLHLFYSHGRGNELPAALDWVHRSLVNRAYVEGTRYYVGEGFLYFTGRLLEATDDPKVHALLEEPLRERIRERMGAQGDALAYAMRILTCASLGIKDEVDMRLLLPLQCEDGGWEVGWIYRYGINGTEVGSRGWTTAMAFRAIEALEKLREEHAAAGR